MAGTFDLNRKNLHFLRMYIFFWLFLFISVSLILSEEIQNEIVYVTNTGKRYHRENCSSLINTKIAVPLTDAIRFYTACSVCNPTIIEANKIHRVNKELYRVNSIGITNSDTANINHMLNAEVIDHVDGDTIRVRITNPPEGLSVIEIIRFLGVDTPEIMRPNQPAQHFAQKASDFTREKLLGRSVYLAFDWDLRDRYGRLLAYIYTAPGRCFNAILIREGLGYAYRQYPFQFLKEFDALEQEAKRQERGLWTAHGSR